MRATAKTLSSNNPYGTTKSRAEASWTKDGAAALLKSGYWFPQLPEYLQEKILRRGRIVTAKRNSSLYRVGDFVDGMYAALAGDLRAYVPDGAGGRVFLRPIGPGSWFGDIHLLDGSPRRSFSVRAKSQCSLLFLPKQDFHEIVDPDRDAYQAFVQLISMHVSRMVQLTLETRSGAPTRTARHLLHLARVHGTLAGESIEIDMRLSQADLASLVGVSRQYMNELLARWAADGIIEWHPNGKHVIDPKQLIEMLPLHEREPMERGSDWWR